MGGDGGPAITVPAVKRFLENNPEIEVTLHGREAELSAALARHFNPVDTDIRRRYQVVFSPEVVLEDEPAASTLRNKGASSLWRSLQQVAEGGAGACVSAGNTGALMAMGIRLLGLATGIDRPAICAALPRDQGWFYLLDVGANVDCSARQLHQFANMATTLVSLVENIDLPSCGLLNIGQEATKGNRLVKEAAALLANDPRLNYRGFVEAHQFFTSPVKIIVSDGFSGNIALKATEGAARFVLDHLYSRLESTAQGESLQADGNRAFKLDPRRYNGAVLLGLKKMVIKSHGSADERGFYGALETATRAVTTGVAEGVCRYFEQSTR